jgi:hypothetical protein
MLNSRSPSLSRGRTAAWADERRNSRRDKIAVRRFTPVAISVDLGDRRLETVGGVEGAAGTDMFGDACAGILAALPMPLGSLIELLSPPALPEPCGIPLTPASCARDFMGAVKLVTNAKAKNADLPNIGHSPVRVPNELTVPIPRAAALRPSLGRHLVQTLDCGLPSADRSGHRCNEASELLSCWNQYPLGVLVRDGSPAAHSDSL